MLQKSAVHAGKTAKYVMNMLPVLNMDALFSDESSRFVSPAEPEAGDDLTIRIRTARANVDALFFVGNGERQQMELERRDNLFDYYCVRMTMPEKPLSYYFEIESGRRNIWYLKIGPSDHLDEHYYFRICPGFSTPEWAKGAVIYQIYTDRFCNGDRTNDVLDHEYCYLKGYTHRVEDWDALPESMDVRNFYGGDLEGVRQKLDYLQDLGIEAIYFNPLFVSPSNHKYDTQDYDHIDPHFGRIVSDGGRVLRDGEENNALSECYVRRVTSLENLEASDELFRTLCDEIHARGMKVILDGVFNHCGSFNKWMDRERIYEGKEGYEVGAYESPWSPYRGFFRFHDESAWPDNGSYEGWWGFETLPKLNYENSGKLVDYILRIAKKWVSPPYSVDGWRLDVAADLGFSAEFNHSFWKSFRTAVKSANPDALILAEHYGDSRPWLMGDEWDTVMNYDAFMEPVTWFLTGMEKHSDQFLPEQLGNADSFFGSMRYHMTSFMEPSLLTAMNELSNHDHSRFLTRTNHIVGRAGQFAYDAAALGVNSAVMREAVVMQMTWPGAPTIYYGDEAGVCGFTDPDNRRTYPWGHEDKLMLDFHREAIRVHRQHSCLKKGSIKFLYGEWNCLAYARFDQDEQIVAAFNNGAHEIMVEIPVWRCGIPMDCHMLTLLSSNAESYSVANIVRTVSQGILQLRLPATSCAVLLAKNE